MRLIAWIGVVVALWPAVASAETDRTRAEELVREGEELGRQGDYEAALERFRAAERVAPDPAHDCWLALTHLRLTQWTQAAYHADRCEQRAGGRAPVDWFEEANAAIQAALEDGGYAPVTVETRPEQARVSSPYLDEALDAPVTLWLPPGSHRFTARAEGHQRATEDVRVDSRSPRTLVVTLAPMPQPPPSAAPEVDVDLEQPAPRERRPGWVPWTAAVGGAAVIAGGVFHTTAYRARQRAVDPRHDYEDEVEALKRDRVLAIGLYGVGAVALTGAILGWTSADASEPETRLSVAITPERVGLGINGRF